MMGDTYDGGYLQRGILTMRDTYDEGYLRRGILTMGDTYDGGYLRRGILTTRDTSVTFVLSAFFDTRRAKIYSH